MQGSVDYSEDFDSKGIPIFPPDTTKIRSCWVCVLRLAIYQYEPHCSSSHPVMMSLHVSVTMPLGQSPGKAIAASCVRLRATSRGTVSLCLFRL